MNRIFLTLSAVANLLLLVAFVLGWQIGDARALTDEVRDAVTLHFLVSLGTSLIVLLIHAVALTYFMGTGRWIEETTEAYKLGETARRENIRLKYRVIPGMVGCVLLLLATGALGAIADPASSYELEFGATIHFGLAVSLLVVNLLVSWVEWESIRKNGLLVDRVVEDVRSIRREKGLDVPTA